LAWCRRSAVRLRAIPDRFASLKAARHELQRSVSHFYAGLEEQELPRVDVKR